MRDAVGGSSLLYLVIIFVTVVMLMFASILTYSKAYRVKNRIIELLEKYEEYVPKDSSWDESNQKNGKYDVVDALAPDLKNAGYDSSYPTRCNSTNVQNHLKEILHSDYHGNLPQNMNNYGYNYCVFEISSDKYEKNISDGKYFVVVTFVQFQFPIIGDVLTFPVYGETKILGKNYDY